MNTENKLVELFFKIGSSRNKDILPLFDDAFQQDPIIATKIALWSRDIREGAGERQIFREILQYLEEVNFKKLEQLIPHIPVYGRYDDLLCFKRYKNKRLAYTVIQEHLKDPTVNRLVAKWLPRENSSNSIIAYELRSFLKMKSKDYRKMLSTLTDVVETKMCSNQWDTIEFQKLPSIAAKRYQNAFNRHTPELYQQYREQLKSGEAKINAGAIFPHDVIIGMKNGDRDISMAQWDALPNYMNEANIIPMVDVSGSMECKVGNNKHLSCMDVAIALGLYCSDKNTSQFKDMFLTFSSEPELLQLEGNLYEKYMSMARSSWGMNTNFVVSFDLILNFAVENEVSSDDMPEYLLVLSDMKFDSSNSSNWNNDANFKSIDNSTLSIIDKKYQNAGYDRPKIVFWNLNSNDSIPVQFNDMGVCMVSGFSPSILKSILAAKTLTPESLMMDTVGSDRYDILVDK